MGYVDQIVQAGSDAMASLWELDLRGGDGWDDLKVRVENVPVMFPKLTIERLANGETYYTGVEFPLDFTLTVRERVDFKAFKYFSDWWDKVFDQDKRVFLSNPKPRVQKGESSDVIHRQATLTFFTFKPAQSETITLDSSMILLTPRTLLNLAVGLPPTLRSDAVPVKRLGSSRPVLKETAMCAFSLTNIKLVGFENLELSYGEGGPLKFQVSLSAEDSRGSVL